MDRIGIMRTLGFWILTVALFLDAGAQGTALLAAEQLKATQGNDRARPSELAPRIYLSLARDFSTLPADLPVAAAGPHRFIEVNGKSGYQPLSLKTSLKIPTALHLQPTGSIVMWVCPLETLGVAAVPQHVLALDPQAKEYGLLSDTFPANDIGNSIFAWYWRSAWHPQMIAKFKTGKAAGGAADFAATPYVPVEHLPLYERQWYQLAFTWDKPASRLRIYVDGILCGTTSFPFASEVPRPELFLGNTSMAFAELAIYDTELSAADVARGYERAAYPMAPGVRDELRELFTVQPKPPADWRPDSTWNLRLDKKLTDEGDFDGWVQQGCLDGKHVMKERRITPEGLLLQTPDEVAVETRVYFWSPQIFEGDVAVEYEFRPEQRTGLALLVVQASGLQREDFMTDHPLRTTGSMMTIIGDRVRNYHWEYFRHSVDVRGDLGTHVLIKNPWGRPLGMSTTPLIAVGAWHKLQFVQEGARLRAAIDGEWVLDVRDDAFDNNGPILNSGRIGLRLMYATRMRFRNLKVWNRDAVEILSTSQDAPHGTAR